MVIQAVAVRTSSSLVGNPRGSVRYRTGNQEAKRVMCLSARPSNRRKHGGLSRHEEGPYHHIISRRLWANCSLEIPGNGTRSSIMIVPCSRSWLLLLLYGQREKRTSYAICIVLFDNVHAWLDQNWTFSTMHISVHSHNGWPTMSTDNQSTVLHTITYLLVN